MFLFSLYFFDLDRHDWNAKRVGVCIFYPFIGLFLEMRGVHLYMSKYTYRYVHIKNMR